MSWCLENTEYQVFSACKIMERNRLMCFFLFFSSLFYCSIQFGIVSAESLQDVDALLFGKHRCCSYLRF